MAKQVQFTATDTDTTGIERDFTITVDGDQVDINYDVLLNEFNNLCAAINITPSSTPTVPPAPPVPTPSAPTN